MKLSRNFLIAFILSVCFISLVSHTKAESRTVESVEDTTLRRDSPDCAYGANIDLLIGDWSERYYEAVLMFNLTTEFLNFTIAEFWFEVMSLGDPITLEFYEMSSFWTEDSITWNNAPPAGKFITNISVSEAIVYKINITSSVEYKTGPFSIRINSTDSSWVRMACKETTSGELHPQIRYDYQVDVLIGEDLSLFLFISIFIGSIVFVALIRREKRIKPSL